jgi:predicted ester cyclase
MVAMPPDPTRLQDLAERYTAAWCRQNPASVAEFYSPNGSLSINGGVPAIGRMEIAEPAGSFMSKFPDLRVVMDKLVVQGNNAEYHWTLSGTNTGPGGTGNQVRISGFELWQIGADGLIVLSRGQFDAADYDRQLKHGIEAPK